MNTVIKDILTGIDGQTYAVIKVLGLVIVIVFLVLEVLAFALGRAFDGQAYGIGAMAALGAMGAAIKLTETSEPKDAPNVVITESKP
jgi:hypothetical protein